MCNKEIDSIYKKNRNNAYGDNPKIFYDLLQWSKKNQYYKGEYKSLTMLMLFYGNKKKIDSVNHYVQVAEKIECKIKDKKDIVNYYTHKGYIYSTYLGSTSKAINYYKKGLQLIKNKKKLIEEAYKIKARISYCYIQKKQYDKAIENLNVITKNSAFITNETLIDIYSILAIAWQKKKVVKKSKKFNSKALKLVKENDDIAYFKNALSYDYYLEGNIDKAIDCALSIRDYMIENKIVYLVDNSAFLATFYGAKGNYKIAIKYAKHNIENTHLIQDLPDKYSQLSGFYENLGKLDLALIVKNKGAQILDSIRAEEQEYLTSVYENETELKDNVEKENTLNKLLNLNKVSLFIIFVLFLSVVITYSVTKNKNLLALKFNNEKKILKEQIKIKEDKLSAIRLVQEEKTKKLEKCKNQLLYNSEIKNLESITTAISEVINSFSICKNLFYEEDEKEDYFTLLLRKKHPELTPNEIKHCFLLHNGLSLKETAQVLNVSVNTVKSARYRAKIKISISSNTNLKDYLNTVSFG